jgi:hypothetical protein
MVVVRKTARSIEKLQMAKWKPSPKTNADEQCEFLYQPEGWATHIVSWRYAMSGQRRTKSQSNTNSSIRRGISTGSS